MGPRPGQVADPRPVMLQVPSAAAVWLHASDDCGPAGPAVDLCVHVGAAEHRAGRPRGAVALLVDGQRPDLTPLRLVVGALPSWSNPSMAVPKLVPPTLNRRAKESDEMRPVTRFFSGES